jgi:hypothetical protein
VHACLEVDALGAAARESDVEDLGERGHDGRRVDAARDEVHVLEVLANEAVVAVDEMRNRLDHAVLLVVGHLGHQPKVEDDELPLGGAQHVARVRVGVEEASVEQLREVRDDAQVDQFAHVVRRALAQLLAVHPLRHVHAPGGDVRVVARDLDTRQHAHVARDADAVGALELVVELAVEVGGKLVE